MSCFSKVAMEPSSSAAGFYSSMFVVPKCTGGLWPYLTLSGLIVICIYLILRCLPSDVWQLIQHGDYAFSVNLQDAYLHIPVVKHHHHFLQFCLAQSALSVEGFTFWAGHSP